MQVIAQSFINPQFKKYWKLPTELACPANLTEPTLPESSYSLHVPLFLWEYESHGLFFMIKKWMMGPFLHFINFFFPLFGYEGHSAEVINSLTPAQLATIHYVNSFLQSRSKITLLFKLMHFPVFLNCMRLIFLCCLCLLRYN